MRWMIGGAIVAFLAAGSPTHAADGVVTCSDFKSNWAAALTKLGLTARPPTYGAPDASGTETVQGIPGLGAQLTCRDSILGHFELRPAGDAAPFEPGASSILMGLDREMTQDAAAAALGALKAEMGRGKQAANTSWGPYELTWTGPAGGAGEELILDLAEN